MRKSIKTALAGVLVAAGVAAMAVGVSTPSEAAFHHGGGGGFHGGFGGHGFAGRGGFRGFGGHGFQRGNGGWGGGYAGYGYGCYPFFPFVNPWMCL